MIDTSFGGELYKLKWVEIDYVFSSPQIMMENDKALEIPVQQRMQRQASVERGHGEEYKAALERAVALEIPDENLPLSYGTFSELEEGENSSQSIKDTSVASSTKQRDSWDKFIKRFFDEDQSGRMVFKKS